MEGEFPLTDSERRTETADRQLAVLYTVRNGQVVRQPTAAA